MAAGSGESTTQVVPPSPGRSHPERRRWVVTGQVQGVGFRPFVYHLARSHALTGFVRNDTNGVTIEAEGSRERLDLFALALRRQIPPLSRIDRIRCRRIPCERITHDFRIEVSEDGRTLRADVTPDAALCRDCLRELLDPENPRFGYGLITCTHCGPRYTITRRIPYDRPGTTMSVFDMCPRCRQEYTDPTNRRFHAQPIACLDCGPVMRLLDPQGRVLADDPIKQAATRILAGDIIAIKGLGGFHLAVKADIAGAVRRLRRLKQRDDKPLALMCRSLEATRRLVRLSPQGAAVMQSAACPIVLAPRRTGAPVAEQIAPGSHRLGVMLPYTPIQHLLWRGLPADTIALVMTSANRRGEPLVYRNEDALERLGQMCDAILWHDRPIARGVDDSVVIDIAGEAPLPLRRARGFVPGSCSLPGVDPDSVSAGLCVGGELKNTVAVVQAGRAILSQHVGDLSHPLTHAEFSGALEDLVAMYGVAPRWIAHDLNPIYLSTVRARVLAEEHGIPLLAIQHHHAHAAAVLADNGHTGPVLAIVCDGAGYGPGGEAWGGELLLADLISYRRLARLQPLRLPGGDAAARETRRCAMALLERAYGPDFARDPVARRLYPDSQRRRVLAGMIAGDIQCLHSSSAGRLFDGVAALLDLCPFNHFEAQAACRLEAEACGCRGEPPRPGEGPWSELRCGSDGNLPWDIDWGPGIRELLRRREKGCDVPSLALLFHDRFAAAWVDATSRAMEVTGVRTVALSGGVLCNELLMRLLTEGLEERGARVLRHRDFPPNDGGLALGQAAIAAAHVAAGWPASGWRQERRAELAGRI